jgi:hypothetical protein
MASSYDHRLMVEHPVTYFKARHFLAEKDEDDIGKFIRGYGQHITTLDLVDIDIAPMTAYDIGRRLHSMPALRTVYVSSGMVLDRMLGAGRDQVVKKSNIDTLFLDGVKLNNHECQRLTAYLANNPCLCRIHFDDCQLENKAMIENQLERNQWTVSTQCSICQHPIRME